MTELFVKITPNSNYWILPSGNKMDLSKQTTVFEKLHGYGHEEWLFNPRYIVDEFQYGHIRSLEGSLKFENNQADKVYLYSILRSGNSREAYYHGYIDNVENINYPDWRSQYPSVANRFISTLSLARSEVTEVGGDISQLNIDTFKPIIRFRPEDVHLLIQSIPIPNYPFNRDKYYEAHNIVDYPEINLSELHHNQAEQNIYLDSESAFSINLNYEIDRTTEDLNLSVSEGTENLVIKKHLVKERNSAIVTAKKNQAIKQNKLKCEICSFSFIITFGKYFIECHHINPIGSEGTRITRLEDLALVCPNCHRMLHSQFEGRFLNIDELRKRLEYYNKNESNHA